jgi:hypothetical protein
MWLSVSAEEFKPLPDFLGSAQARLAESLWQSVNTGNTRLWTALQQLAADRDGAFDQMVHFNQIKKQAQQQYLRALNGTADNWFIDAPDKRRGMLKRLLLHMFGPNRPVQRDPLHMRHLAFLRTLTYCHSTRVLFHYLGLARSMGAQPGPLADDPLYQLQCRIAVLGILELLIKRQDLQTAVWMGRAAGLMRQGI